MTRVGSGSSLRASSLMTSSVASSAQWTSSRTRTFGVCCRRSFISAVTTSCGGASRATASTSAPPRPSATARRRSKRPRREQRIAPAGEHLYGLRLLVTEPTDECRLADACLSDDDDEPPAPDRSLRNRTREHIECALALEQIELLSRPG